MAGERHAEICGAGLAGLTTATVLARAGWSVSVHERADEIREVGAGIYLKNNLLSVLEHLGVAEQVRTGGIVLERSQMRDGRGAILQDHDLADHRRTWMCPRENLIRALAGAARQAGVEVRLGSRVVAARPEGVVRNERGETFEADVVIAADGVSSAVRESLGLTAQYQRLATVATRYLLPTRSVWPEPITAMHWSGRRRVGVAAASRDQTYVYMICPTDDGRGVTVPVDVASWSASFPALDAIFKEIERGGSESIQHQYNIVRCCRWVAGRVALVGDAAHAQPPTLGQGGGLALANSYALAQHLVGNPGRDVTDVLRSWERECRPLTDRTQRWAMGLDRITNRWPTALLPLRTGLLWVMGRSSFIQGRMRAAERFDGTVRTARARLG
ncbi:FAD-dependent monooxygenase [Dactylosporangium roseum]|uniref:FAD-dependent monooxygenase n=1 Tax=Dactylosporangium roseum TaxID=47989 RepID=A0ABY5ZE61_9ACTN|nr:NAD(P)/FAD-dependent oxidoreductase [Dactylosporangium roseum]UWZ39240.1 FAD-dependent monooxygenase [Dactylosporangium roseum]